jgi:Tol biopolymer transport system component
MCGFADGGRRNGWVGWQFNSGVMHMQSSKLASMARRTLLSAALAAAALASVPQPGSAQYFGRNKVQFDDFEFQVLRTDHFDIHYYPEEQEAVEDAARMAERWYERFARAFQHEFEQTKPIILYADHPDFEQTNTLSGFIGEGTGGVTESLKNRVIMPIAGSYWDTDHVMGHELVHAFQYNIAQSRRGGGLQGLYTLPLWVVEGIAEYLSVGRDDPLTAMWIRDAISRDELPTIHQLTNDRKFFPYRFGQALWAYIGGTYGDDAVIQIYRRSLRVGFEGAISQVLGLSTDTLSVRWRDKTKEEYLPLMEGRNAPEDQGTLILAPSTGSGRTNIAPAISPDGRYVAFLSEKDLFSVDLFMAEVATGRIIRKLSSANSDPHIEALRYIDSSGTWSPDSQRFAYVVTAGGNQEIVIVGTANGQIQRRIAFDRIGAVSNPAWSPDGQYLAFSGSVGGITDLYLFDLDSEETIQLTNDKYADLQPSWAPDGRTIAFMSDRGAETNFERLTYSKFQLTTIDIATSQVRVIPVFGNVKHINPQYSADNDKLYFLSDQDGFTDVYELDFQNGDVRRITNLTTAVSGHTYLSPAMTVAQDGTIAYTVFDELEFHIYTTRVDDDRAQLVEVVDNAEDQVGRKLPPANPDRFSRIATYLADPETGLLPSNTWTDEDREEYKSELTLDFVGQPSIGVGTDNFGNYIGGGASAFFSDMLGDHVLGISAQANGTFKDIGGQAFYTDLSNRWNWGVGAGRIPYLLGYYAYGSDERGQYIGQTRYRINITSASGQVSYPFSSTQRFEVSLGMTRYSYDIELDKFYTDQFGRIYDFERVQQDEFEPDPLNMATASVALVGDNAFFGFVSPIRGGRYRFGVEQTAGTLGFTTVTADWRRYFAPLRNLTVGVRALHYGRYGLDITPEQQGGFSPLRELFLGFETFIRGYSFESFETAECGIPVEGAPTGSSCPTFDRLFGHRLAVGSLELRVPFIGVEQFGIINFPFLPTELVLFADGGLAWDPDSPPTLEWSRSSSERVPVFSTGVSARFNVLGFMILEAYYAYPWQRPDKGWHWGFNLSPGW